MSWSEPDRPGANMNHRSTWAKWSSERLNGSSRTRRGEALPKGSDPLLASGHRSKLRAGPVVRWVWSSQDDHQRGAREFVERGWSASSVDSWRMGDRQESISL